MLSSSGSALRNLVRAALLTRGLQIPLRAGTAPLRRCGWLPKRWWVRLPVVGSFSLSLEGRRVRYASAGEYLGRVLYWAGPWRYEPATARALFSLAPSFRVFVDIGAYTGWLSLVASAAHEDLAVYAFEPIPGNRKLVERNFHLNRLQTRATVVEAAVGDTTGRKEFFQSCDRLPPSTSSYYRAHAHSRSVAIEVDAISLDDFRESTGIVPDLIKIDAEGAEAAILRGAQRVIREGRPVFLIEVLDGTSAASEVPALLTALGYRHHPLSEEGNHGRNLLAWPPERDELIAACLELDGRSAVP